MKNMFMRLRSKKGETLVESMAAILIFTFASIIMFSMISAANDINLKTREAESRHQEQMLVAEKAEGAGVSTKVKITVDGSTTVEIPVTVYSKESGALYAYYPQEAGGAE